MEKQYGLLLKQARHIYAEKIGAKVTQSQFAELLGISRGYLADMETDRTEPSASLLEKIALKVGLSLEFFQKSEHGRTKVAIYSGIRSIADFDLSDRIVGYIDLPSQYNSEEFVGMIISNELLAGLGIHTGDFVILRKSPDIVEGSISLVVLNDGTPILRRIHTQGQLIMLSTVEATPTTGMPKIVDPSQTDIMVFGRAVKAIINL